MTSPLVVAVVLNWNLGEVTVRCVERLRSSTYPRLQVVVVDNGSSDGSVEQLRATFSDVDVLAISENRGYAEGVNVGIRHALALGAEWVLLVNNDAEVAPEAITKLVAAAGSTIGLVTPRIDALPSGRLWHAGARTSRLTLLPYELGPAELAKGHTLRVDYATGLRADRPLRRAVLHLLRGPRLLDPRPCGRLSDPGRPRNARLAPHRRQPEEGSAAAHAPPISPPRHLVPLPAAGTRGARLVAVAPLRDRARSCNCPPSGRRGPSTGHRGWAAGWIPRAIRRFSLGKRDFDCFLGVRCDAFRREEVADE
jgi:hypothetical protein